MAHLRTTNNIFKIWLVRNDDIWSHNVLIIWKINFNIKIVLTVKSTNCYYK